MSIRHSKVQLKVLSLYKACLRASQSKPGAKESVQFEFRKNAQIPKTEMMRIEYLLRQGERKLAMIKDPNVSGLGTFVGDKKNQ